MDRYDVKRAVKSLRTIVSDLGAGNICNFISFSKAEINTGGEWQVKTCLILIRERRPTTKEIAKQFKTRFTKGF